MDDGPNPPDAATRAALPLQGRRDACLEQRLGYLAGELARLEGRRAPPALFAGAMATYRRFLFTADPAHRFHCWATLQAVSAELDRLERGGADPEVPGSAPGGPDPGQALAAALTDQPH